MSVYEIKDNEHQFIVENLTVIRHYYGREFKSDLKRMISARFDGSGQNLTCTIPFCVHVP